MNLMEPMALGIDATIFVVSHVKYMLGVALAMGLGPDMSGVWVAAIGAASGTVLWVHAGGVAHRLGRRWIGSKRPRRIVTRTRRMLVRLKRRRALWAIALLTPVLLSMPVGCALALSVEPRPRRVVLAVWAAVLAWSVALVGVRALLPEAASLPGRGSSLELVDDP